MPVPPATRDAGAPEADPPAETATTRLVVTIVIDQLAAWIADERWKELPETGGFARLRKEGTYVRDMRHTHAVTDTGPGHAALYTGAPARVSGVFGNERFDDAGHRLATFADLDAKIVASDGLHDGQASSAKVVRVDTVADVLRATDPNAVILSVSLKDRAAIPGGGRKPTLSLWYDTWLDRFVSSTAFAQTLPAWTDATARIVALRKEPWTPFDPKWVAAHALTPDAQPGEGNVEGLGTVFPHEASKAKKPPTAFRVTPFADDIVLELALTALDSTPRAMDPKGHTLLAISLSANDYIGHTFGPDSWEAWDQLARLDAKLGRFFAELDKRVGANGWSAVLAADHGISMLPEASTLPGARPWCAKGATDRWQRPCTPITRLPQTAITKELVEAAHAAVGPGDFIKGISDPLIFFTAAAHQLDSDKKKKLFDAVVAKLRSHPEIDRLVDGMNPPDSCPPENDESIDALVCRSIVPGVADIYVTEKPGHFFDAGYGYGAAHGSAYLYDRSVPMLARAPGLVRAGVVIEEPLDIRTYAKTASSMLRIDPPGAASMGRDLRAP